MLAQKCNLSGWQQLQKPRLFAGKLRNTGEMEGRGAEGRKKNKRSGGRSCSQDEDRKHQTVHDLEADRQRGGREWDCVAILEERGEDKHPCIAQEMVCEIQPFHLLLTPCRQLL